MSIQGTNRTLSLREIAAWQIPGLAPEGRALRAELPALQRGAVWRAPQVEALWDSILRGFPIGAFLLAPFDAARGHASFRYAGPAESSDGVTHHLLDGQQRANAIALGFLDPWSMPADVQSPAALWIDIEAPGPEDGREHVFRVLTPAHPWGYRYSTLASAGPRLDRGAMRHALKAYGEVTPELLRNAGDDAPLTHTWPWEAHAPVPLCTVLEAVARGGDVAGNILQRVASLPVWRLKSRNVHGAGWTRRVEEILRAPSGPDREQRERLISSLDRCLHPGRDGEYRVPALVIPDLAPNVPGRGTRKAPDEVEAERQDPVETLFIRINSGGTPLVGEELIYSILKSIWPDAGPFIEGMDVRLAQPSRIVILASRLVLAEQPDFQDKVPAAPDVTRFRRLIHGTEDECKRFREKLLRFFQKGEAASVFRGAQALLTHNGACDLPPVLAADVAKHSPEVMFLLLRWLRKMQGEHLEASRLRGDTVRRIVGAVTALSWFAENPGHCLASLWPALQQASGQTLRSFFSARAFARCFGLTNGKLGLLPLVPPHILEDALRHNVQGRGFNTPTSRLWQNWTRQTLGDDRRLGEKLLPWYNKSFKELWTQDDVEEESAAGDGGTEVEAHCLQAWQLFIDRLWGERRLVLFAQARWLVEWFPRYDPIAVDQMDEADRPWDMDHIHPRSYIENRKNVPQMIRAWHGSIGNLRAWPLQANRSDGDSVPRNKLSLFENLKDFKIESEEELLLASFVERGDDLEHWNGSAPEGDFVAGYLGKPSEFWRCRQCLVLAIIQRFLRLYAWWYEETRIAELGP